MPNPELTPHSSGGPAPWRTVLLGVAIVLVTLVAYAPAIDAGFIWDDDRFLLQHPLIRASDGLYRFWCTREAADYFPLTSTLLWAEWRLWGADPTGYHVVNLLLHALGAVLVWRVLLRLNVPGAWLAGMLFALHPVTVSSAAWITEGKNTLSLLLFLLSLLTYLRATADPQSPSSASSASCVSSASSVSSVPSAFCLLRSAFCLRSYLLSLLLFLLALLAKTSVVALPAVLLLCAWWQRGRIDRRDIARTAPFFLLALALGLVEMWFQQHNAIAGVVVRPEGFASRLAAAGWAVWFYLYKALLPINLLMVYPRWSVDPRAVLAWAPLALLLITFAVLWHFRRTWGRAPLVALACFVVALLPVLGFIDMAYMQYALVADHWQYLALIGVAALAGAAGQALWLRARGVGRTAVGVVIAGVLLALAVLTWRQSSLYHDEETLWRQNTAANPACWPGFNNLGNALLARGKISNALECYEKALKINPNYEDPHYNIGNINLALGRVAPAIAHYREALRINPNDAEVHNNLGRLLDAQNQTAEAIEHYRRAIALKPDLAPACANLAWLRATHPLAAVRDGAEALTLAQRACALSRDSDVRALDALAAAYAEMDCFAEAQAAAEKAHARALAAGRTDLAPFIQQRIDLYKSGRPFREKRPAAQNGP